MQTLVLLAQVEKSLLRIRWMVSSMAVLVYGKDLLLANVPQTASIDLCDFRFNFEVGAADSAELKLGAVASRLQRREGADNAAA